MSGPNLRMIDLQPTWTQVLPLLITALQQATPAGQRMAVEELERMAKAADHYVASQPVVKHG